jgi:thioredoxin 1
VNKGGGEIMLELTLENFHKEVLESEIPVIVDFWAGWCRPCQMMAPVFERVSKSYEGKIKFAKCNTEESPELSNKYGIRSIPCLLVFSKGKVMDMIVGFMADSQLKSKIEMIAKSYKLF